MGDEIFAGLIVKVKLKLNGDGNRVRCCHDKKQI
jgi:hypothetical protein